MNQNQIEKAIEEFNKKNIGTISYITPNINPIPSNQKIYDKINYISQNKILYIDTIDFMNYFIYCNNNCQVFLFRINDNNIDISHLIVDLKLDTPSKAIEYWKKFNDIIYLESNKKNISIENNQEVIIYNNSYNKLILYKTANEIYELIKIKNYYMVSEYL